MTDARATDWSDVRGRIEHLSSHAGATQVFGANGHRWRLEPPLAPADVAHLERNLGIELPQAYRSFLTDVSGGGAGPYCGLFPVRHTASGWEWDGDGPYVEDRGLLAKPFPHVAAFNPVGGLPSPPEEDDFATTQAYDEAADAYWDQHDQIAWAEENYAGLLTLCHLGCAIREPLVVTGPARGQMWHDDTANDNGFTPLTHDDGQPLDFAGWYRRWLDEAEHTAASQALPPPTYPTTPRRSWPRRPLG